MALITPSDLSILLDDLDLTEPDDRRDLAEWAATRLLEHLDIGRLPPDVGLSIVERIIAALSTIDLTRDPAKVAERQKRRALRRAMRGGENIEKAASIIAEADLTPTQATALRLLVREAIRGA